MAPSFASTSTHVDSVPAPDQPAQESTATPAPKKKPRRAALADAKKILRASTAVTSQSLAAPEFVHRPPDIARHRRKCAVCHHPEREIIEDLFIHWHSPATIAEYYEDDGTGVNWVSIYRHAYAFGLDEVRRRNLRFAFELIIEQAADIHATSAAIIASARALGNCVNPDGRWTEPPKRVHVTNHIYRHDASAQANSSGGPSFARSAKGGTYSTPDCSENVENGSSFRASHPPVLSEVEGREFVTSRSTPAPSAEVSGGPSGVHFGALAGATGLRQAAQSEEVAEGGVSSASSTVNADSSDIEVVPEDSSIRAPHPREVLASAPADSQLVSSASAAPGVPGCTNRVENDSSFRASYPHDVVASQSASARPDDLDMGTIEKSSSYRALHPRDVVSGDEIRNPLNSFKSKEPPISNR